MTAPLEAEEGPFSVRTWDQPGRPRWNRHTDTVEPGRPAYGYNLARDGRFIFVSQARYRSAEGALRAGVKDARDLLDFEGRCGISEKAT